MPYKNLDDLPENIQSVLPKHAQEIYRASYNNAYEEYQDERRRRDPQEDLESICHKVAWSAVKQKYRKNEEGKWIEGGDS